MHVRLKHVHLFLARAPAWIQAACMLYWTVALHRWRRDLKSGAWAALFNIEWSAVLKTCYAFFRARDRLRDVCNRSEYSEYGDYSDSD